jgi:hypothetical protein
MIQRTKHYWSMVSFAITLGRFGIMSTAYTAWFPEAENVWEEFCKRYDEHFFNTTRRLQSRQLAQAQELSQQKNTSQYP